MAVSNNSVFNITDKACVAALAWKYTNRATAISMKMHTYMRTDLLYISLGYLCIRIRICTFMSMYGPPWAPRRPVPRGAMYTYMHLYVYVYVHVYVYAHTKGDERLCMHRWIWIWIAHTKGDERLP